MFLLLFNVHYWIYTFTLVDFWFNLCLFFSRFIHCVYTFLLLLDLLNHFQIIFFYSNNVSDSVWLCTIFLKIVFQSVTLLLLLLLYTLKQIYMNLFWVCARQQGGRRRKTEEGKASEGGKCIRRRRRRMRRMDTSGDDGVTVIIDRGWRCLKAELQLQCVRGNSIGGVVQRRGWYLLFDRTSLFFLSSLFLVLFSGEKE